MTMGRGNHAVRSERWRYIRYSDGAEELYDHEKDPWEWNNLLAKRSPQDKGEAAKSKYADVIAQHKAWLPKNEVPWQIDESKNWIYTQVMWDDTPVNEK